MKSIPTLIAMLVAGSAFAGEVPQLPSFANVAPERPSFDIRKCDISPGAVVPPSSTSSLINKPADPNLVWASSPSKVDYSIVTLPDGKTASVLTFK